MALTRQFLLAGIVVSALAGVLLLVGLVTPHWLTLDGVAFLGLWKMCAEDQQGNEACVIFSKDVAGWVHATRAFDVIATMLLLLASAFGIVPLCRSGHPTFVKIAALLCALGGICSVVAFGIFAGEYKDLWTYSVNPKFDYSFGFTVTAAVLSAIACAVFLRGYRSGYNSL